jgi:hypothetical protein
VYYNKPQRDSTKIEQDKAFFNQTATDVTALVPGLTIEARESGMPTASSMPPR